jgi:Mycothiol maleylpyruvate isomerase N-terminal domain
MTDAESYVARNAAELARMRRLVGDLTDEQLASPVNEHWTVAAALAHVAFWDARALYLAERLQAGQPFTADHREPDDVDWINDSYRPLAHAVPPRAAAELALRIATDTDARMASLTDEERAKAWPADEDSPLNLLRAAHRAEHLDELEAAIRAS